MPNQQTIEQTPVEALLRRERKRFTTYWTLLSEMHIRRQLPEWVRAGFAGAGSHEDWDAQSADQQATDLAIKGAIVPSRYLLGVDNGGTVCLQSRDGVPLFEGAASELPARHADALFEFTRPQLDMFVRALHRETSERLGLEATHD